MGHVSATFTQAGFRWRNDDGNESTATYAAALNTSITLETATVTRCRIILDETAGGAENNVSTQWQYQINSGGWNNVTTSSSVVQAVTSTQGSLDATATTQQISAGTFVSAEVTEDGLSDAVRPSFAGNEVTELELVFQLIDADVADTDTVELRVVRADLTLFDTYSQIPSLTVDKGAAPVVVQASPASLSTGAQAVAPTLAALSVSSALASMTVAAQTVSPQVGSGGGLPVTSGLHAHFDADALTGFSDNDPVTTWPDESANGLDFTGGSPLYKTGVLNGKPVVRSDGTDELSNTTLGWDMPQPITVFIVWKSNDTSGTDLHLISDPDNNGFLVRLRNQSATTFDLWFGSAAQNLQSLPTDGFTEFVYSTIISDATPNTKVYRENGVEVVNVDEDGTRNWVQGAIFGKGTGNFTISDIAEMVVYDRRLNSTEITDTESYLDSKWFGTAGVSVQAVPATLATSAKAASPQQTALTVSATPATLAAAAQTVTPVLAPVAIQVSPASLTTAAQTTNPTQAALATQASPASLTAAAQIASPSVSGAPVTIQAAPATVTTAAQTVTPTQSALTVTASPATLAATGQQTSPQQTALSFSAAPATATTTASVVSPQVTSQGVTVEASPATLATSAETVATTQAALTVQANPANITVDAQTVQPTIAGAPVAIQAVPAVLTTTAQAVNVARTALAVQADPVTVSTEAQALVPSFDALVLQAVAATVNPSASAVTIVGGEGPPVITAVGKAVDLVAVGKFIEPGGKGKPA